MGRTIALVIAGIFLFGFVMMIVVTSLGDQGTGVAQTDAPSPGGEGGPVPVTRTATVLLSVPLHRVPDGPEIRDEFGEHAEQSRVGQRVTVLAVQGAGVSGQWARVYLHVDPSAWPGDFFAWLPLTRDGRPVLKIDPPVACPAQLTFEAILALAPFDRARCAGERPIELDVRTAFGVGYTAYTVEPAFFGGRGEVPSSVGLVPIVDKLVLATSEQGDRFLDAQTAPGVERIPVDFDLRIGGRFNDPASGTCRRAKEQLVFDPPPPRNAGMPPEAAEDSEAWCRTRFVVTGWRVLRGPERAPVVPGSVQLHRAFEGATGCGGVGMDAPVTFRIDLEETDPVWLEGNEGFRILPLFSRDYRFVAGPVPAIVNSAGLTIRDGTSFIPDKGFSGTSFCPMGSMISFD